MKSRTLAIAFTSIASVSCAQETDTLKTLQEVVVQAFDQNSSPRHSALSVYRVDTETGDRSNKLSLTGLFNAVPGLRMEERSPGSFRVSIRGSSLRSPFGVRNVKIYWNDIPLTDAGGNTYLNQVAYNNFSHAEIFKGPAGSLYGAGTGGLLLQQLPENPDPGASVEYITGSYGLNNFFANAALGDGENSHRLSFAHNESKGYRRHSSFRRDNFSWVSRLKTGDRQELTASLLLADLHYETPGALTLAEYLADPAASRPAAGGFPSAEQARAGIFQKNITAGFTGRFSIQPSLRNTTTVYAAFAEIRNPAIRNYERRKEPQFGGRSIFSWQPGKNQRWRVSFGGEYQKGFFNTLVTKNRDGQPDSLLSNDDIDYSNYFLFTQASGRFGGGWLLNAGLSLNRISVAITRLSRYPVITQARKYRNELAPSVSLRRNLGAAYLKATVSRGFSPPTIGELLPSTGVISTELEAEYGWNYEFSAGANLLQQRLWLEATAYYFRLNNALVQRRDNSGADYFVNAGDTRQKGLELMLQYARQFSQSAALSRIFTQAGFTYQHFRYGSFVKGSEDFSGRVVPSVPERAFSAALDLGFGKSIYSAVTYQAVSAIFLNDANSARAEGYHLFGVRAGIRNKVGRGLKLEVYLGVDNLLDERYSPGNDINAAAGRYYNAAAGRNFFAGLKLQWLREKSAQ